MSFEDRVRDVITQAIKSKAKEIYDESQTNCPVKTGFLKYSGTYFDVGNLVGLMYSAPYSSIVENGQKAGWRTVASYATSSGKIVSAHTSWRSATPGRHFISNAVDNGKQTLSKEVDGALRQNFKVL
jgi:hypothetical protein